MRSTVRFVLIPAAVLSLAACRQADGPIPTPNLATQNEIDDLSRDLLGVVSRVDQSDRNLADGLHKYTENPDILPAFDELARRTSSVVAGSRLSQTAAQQLAHALWLTVAAREMSGRQVEALQTEMQAVLIAAGVPEPDAQPVVAQVGEVQRLVTARPKRWYEFY
jgi:hypothetical protein